jgi:regulator of protease activity HflC (stomatin/prohibitin superfamily)
MLTQIWELLKSVASDLVPVAKVSPWERALVLRFHRFRREIGPGWHLKFPIIESVIETTVVTTTSSLPPQSLTTSDGRGVVVEAIVRYSISDPQRFLLEVCDRDDAINDTAMGIIAKQVRLRTWADCCGDSSEAPGTLESEITKRVRASLRKWGVAVEEVTIVSMARMRSLRLIGNLHPPQI